MPSINVANSARACSIVTPGRNRAEDCTQRPALFSWRASLVRSGVQMLRQPICPPRLTGGITPMIVKLCPSIRNDLPTISRSSP